MYIIYKTGHPVQYLDFGLGLVTVEQKAMMIMSGKGDLELVIVLQIPMFWGMQIDYMLPQKKRE